MKSYGMRAVREEKRPIILTVLSAGMGTLSSDN